MLRPILLATPIGLLIPGHAGNAEPAAAPPSHWFISSQTPESARNYLGSVDHTTARSRSQVSQVLRGSTAWRKVELVITVPSSAVALAYGVQMKGGGTVWIDHVRIETRPAGDQDADATPRVVTYNLPPPETLSEPANLDFEE